MRCVLLWKCFAVCLSALLVHSLLSAASYTYKQEHIFTLPEPTSQIKFLPGHRCWMVMWVKMWLLATSLLLCDRNPVCQKKSQCDGEQTEKERERKGETEEGNSMCFWLIWHSYLWIQHRCFHTSLLASLLAYFPLIPPPNIPSFSSLFHPLFTYFLFMSSSESLPSLRLSLIYYLWPTSPAHCATPAPPSSACSEEGRLC